MSATPATDAEVVQPDLDRVAAAALASPLVADLTGGHLAEAATYLPGRRLVGVRRAGDAIEVHVVARWGASLPDVADAVRSAVSPYAGGRPVSVFIDDIEVPGPEPADAAP